MCKSDTRFNIVKPILFYYAHIISEQTLVGVVVYLSEP
jgi:hypothetical protein